MKNLNTNPNLISNESTDSFLSPEAISFNEVVVYNEMADQTSVRLNLIGQVQAQLNQLDEMLGRKQFVLREIFNEIVK